MREGFSRTIGFVVFFGLFIGLLSLVGNPAKEETIIIFLIAFVCSVFSYLKLSGKGLDRKHRCYKR